MYFIRQIRIWISIKIILVTYIAIYYSHSLRFAFRMMNHRPISLSGENSRKHCWGIVLHATVNMTQYACSRKNDCGMKTTTNWTNECIYLVMKIIIIKLRVHRKYTFGIRFAVEICADQTNNNIYIIYISHLFIQIFSIYVFWSIWKRLAATSCMAKEFPFQSGRNWAPPTKKMHQANAQKFKHLLRFFNLILRAILQVYCHLNMYSNVLLRVCCVK